MSLRLEFICKLINQHIFSLLNRFLSSEIYIDDCLLLKNPGFERFAHVSNTVIVEDNLTDLYSLSRVLNKIILF